jgi:hypothetical protein
MVLAFHIINKGKFNYVLLYYETVNICNMAHVLVTEKIQSEVKGYLRNKSLDNSTRKHRILNPGCQNTVHVSSREQFLYIPGSISNR